MYDRPANLFVAGFIGSPAMNLVEVPIADGGVEFGNSVVPVSREALSARRGQGRPDRDGGRAAEHFDVVGQGGDAPALAKDASAGLAVTRQRGWRSWAPTATSTARPRSAGSGRTSSSASTDAASRRRGATPARRPPAG
ncbi:hypothetical protein GCM10020221_08460 [Streptomyces thioluteus]|uniref:Uncharacterized protein n=1 Tax=Streptomyces thioluteus TaxID=66431 RepID=A0ABN3WHW1_STRTU